MKQYLMVIYCWYNDVYLKLGEHSYGEFVIQNGLKQWDNITIDFTFYTLMCPLKPRGTETEWDTSVLAPVIFGWKHECDENAETVVGCQQRDLLRCKFTEYSMSSHATRVLDKIVMNPQNVTKFKNLSSTVTDQHWIQKEVTSR